ncbi:MAG: amino acid adenylation domain-containing protein, partial [Clostridiaceae bacterium]|nr:amino acid adenylation domain-containing protein [Clostridiaceae bacterium]
MFNFNQITNKEFLSKLFRNLARQKQIPVSVDSSGSQFQATMAFGFKNADKPDLRFDNPDLMLEAGEKIRVIFFFKDVLFYYETQITGQEGNSFQIKNPEAIYTSFRRLMYRYKPAHSEELSLYLPEDDIRYKVHDLSTSGASFEGIDKYFDEGQVFRNITINLNNVEDIHVDAIVKYCRTMSNGNFVCGINFTGMDWLTRQKLFLYIFQRAYPDLKALKDYSSDEILKLYEDSKYLRLKPDNDGENSFVEMVRNIDLLKDKPMIYSNFSYIRNGKLSCIGSVIRIFNRTFFGNRPVTLTNTGLNSIARSDLHIGLAEAMLNHSYFSYYVSYFTRDYSWHKEMFGRLGSFINDKDKIIFGKLQYFECNISELDYIKQYKGYICKVLEDPTDFIEYCKINMEPLEAECYGYDKENFYLNEISQLYEMIGFYANRRLMGVYREEKLAAFVVAECYSEGVSLNSINDGCRIYIPADEVDVQAVIRSAVSGAAVFYKKHKKEKFNILFDYLIKKTELEKIPGADYKGEIGRVMMNYDGMADYKKILLLNFDFLTKYYPLTYPQRDIWYKEKLIPDTDIGNISATIRFEDIDFSLLEKSINMVIERNEGMRIRVVEEYDEPRQYISEYNYRKFDFFDFSNEGKKGLFEWDKLENRISFEITDSDLFYFALFKINEREGGFYIKMHHLISDAWTMVLMTNQVFESYKKLKNGAVTGDGNKPPYIDYILGEEEYLYSDNFEKNKKFWADKFNSIPQFTSLKTVNMQCLNLEATRKTYIIPLDLTIKIKKFLEQSKLSVFMLMMSALYIYLYRITSKEDIVIGTPVLNRSNAKEKNMAGMFISAVPVRIYINGEDSFESFVKYVSKELMLCFKNQKYPYELILKDYRDNNNTNGILNDIVFSYQNAKLEIGEYVENYDARWHFNGSQTESLVIHLNDREDKNEYIVNIDYLVNDFSYDEIERLYEHLLNILKDAIENSSKKIYELEILSQEEKRKLLYDFNNTGADYPKNKTIHELFEEQVNRTPDNVALVCEDKEITYRELNAKANQLAKILKTKGVGKDIIVAVIYERSIEMIVCILGIMKAGGAYLPIDPDYSEERINYMISDSQTNIVLIQENLLHKFDIKIEKLSFNFDSFCEEMGSDIETDGNSDDLAYVIYTSGSTGNPKGVMIQHRGLINFIWWRIQNYKINSKDITLQFISFSFDGFGANLYSSILTGGKLVILNNTRWKDFNYVRRKIKLMKVTNMSLVPSMYKEILSNANMSDLASMRFVVLAGEKSSEYLIKQSKAINNQINLINEYGPTENCITTTAYLGMDEKTHSIIGKPISNTYIYILDSYGGLVPIGVYGELYVSGENLSKGYINNKKLTDEKFVNNPYMRENKMYKTGDIARWLPDGNIEFLGRIDSQIKVQGVRIELEEIRSAVAEYPSITDVIVL